MPVARFQMPDGRIARFEVPEGTTPEQAQAMITQALAEASQPSKPAEGSVTRAIKDIPRQVGLTARYGLEGIGGALDTFNEPFRRMMDNVLPERSQSDPATGQRPPKSVPISATATKIADALGLPTPQTAYERVIGEGAKLMAGSAGIAGGARLATEAPGMVGQAANWLSTSLPQQFTSAAGAGVASAAAKEAGASPLVQAGAALAGGLAAGQIPGVANAVKDGVTSVVKSMSPREMDIQLSIIFNRAGQDYSQLPEAVRQSLRSELAGALKANKEIDPQALARLADFKTVGAIPTRGSVSQNPVQITREMNLAKIGANSADDRLQGLAQVQNSNNSTLIQRLNEAGAAKGDPMAAGEVAVGSIQGRDQALKEAVSKLYTDARNLPGGEIPLDRTKLVNGVFDALAKENKLAYLPDNIANTLNTISQGQVTRNGQTFKVPFDAKALDNLLTDIATAQRSTQDGNVKAALKVAREAINQMPISPVKNTFGGNQLVTQEGAQFLRAEDAKAGQFMDALNEARKAAAQRFSWQESSKPVEAAVSGAEPDKFIQRFVINGTVTDARAVAQNAPTSVVKDAILAHLKDKALNGASDEIGKFSQAAYNKALKTLGDRKLEIFFSPEEIAQLKAIGRVASYVQNQPVGSAVNNSNSGALMLGRGYDLLKSVTEKIPVVRTIAFDPLQSAEITIRRRQAENVIPGLLAPVERPALGPSLLLPAAAAGGLLTAP